MGIAMGFVLGFLAWFFMRYVLSGFYTVDQNERAVKTSFGRAERLARTILEREEVAPQSIEWGYQIGSTYVRKVHFRDAEMIRQIEAKVVNRLRQVTSAIKQDGANQVSIITSSAERTAAVEFAKAQAIRPAYVGEVLGEIARVPQVSDALFEILEIQRLIASQAAVTLVPREGKMLSQFLAGSQ